MKNLMNNTECFFFWTFLLLSISLVSNTLMAQDLEKEILEMNKAYAERDLDVKMHADIYYGAKKQTGLKAHIKKSGDDYWCKMNWITMLQNKDYTIIANQEDKSINWEKTEKTRSQTPKKVELVPAELEKFFSENKWEFIGLTSNSKRYKLPIKLGDIYEMELFLDKRTSVINKIIYHYKSSKENENPTRVEIIYDQTTLDPVFSKDSFSHTQFMRKSAGKWIPSMNYSGYSVFGDQSK